MSAPKEILKLVDQFDRNLPSLKSGAYNETQLRREYLDPFFKALGWDMDNTQGLAEAYKDVVNEDAIRIGGAVKAPDYGFRIGGTRKFFLEAKKPSADIAGEISPAYQLRRYAWSAHLSLSILSDFEELAVYDCRVKPRKNDSAATARLFLCGFRDYPEKWDWIASIFSKDAVLKGSFDKYAETNKAKRGTAEVDDDFLETIEGWRSELAKNLALRNPRLSQRELNFSVQRIIDRIIFLRICEDRGSEAYGRLLALTNGPNIYRRLGEVFEDADAKYNSGLFYFKAEKNRNEPPDELTLKLELDDKLLHDLLKGLYYPESPYEFTVISSDILGQVYEQFLGKVIRLTAGHHAVIEEKPEVKKAGGVYYTPTYIVEYIVRQTVGKLVEDKTPKQVVKIHVLDPACGSGSFLINAYQFLLDWHRDWYVANKPEKWAKGRDPQLVQTMAGWKLTISERKRILLENIYGVDIDPQAVEVTKLSLLLKVLEGESEQTIQPFLRLFQQRAFPDLGNNIKCGNSLIGPDFYPQKELPELSDDERLRINVFDWDAEYPEIMKSGGFDAVIGNPPYIRIQTMKEWVPAEVEIYKESFKSARSGNYDIYVVFIEQGLRLLNNAGRLGLIVPPNFLKSGYGEPIRDIISNGRFLAHLVHFGGQFLFEGATVCSILLFLNKAGSSNCRFVQVDDKDIWRNSREGIEGIVSAGSLTSREWNFSFGKKAALFDKLDKWDSRLADIAERIGQGIRTSANEVFVLNTIREEKTSITAFSDILQKPVKLDKGSISKFLQGREIKPYQVLPSGKVVIVPYLIQIGKATLIPEKEIRERFPNTFSYLSENKKYLGDREKGRFRGSDWYAFGRQQNIDLMLKSKILVPDTTDRASFAWDDEGKYAFTSGYGIILNKGIDESIRYFLGLLNSSVINFYAKRVSTVINKYGFFCFFAQFIEKLPIRRINFKSSAEIACHDQIVKQVDRILSINAQLTHNRTTHETEVFVRQLQSNKKQIDKIVYELYGLTDEEIKIVEESA